tara:strand:- start:1071 stop:1517 length:447 start_codon:yes stop_codon:yes gene_type:complete
MSKTITFKGQIPMGLQDHIRLKTLKGKTGYRIKKFSIISSTPGVGNVEFVAKVTSTKDLNVGPTVDFTDGDIMAVSYLKERANDFYGHGLGPIIFDTEIVNQDIFVSIDDAAGGTVPCNYYLELETITLSDIQATELTLKALRNVASR